MEKHEGLFEYVHVQHIKILSVLCFVRQLTGWRHLCYVEYYFNFGILLTHLLFPFLATPSGPTVFPLSQCGSGTDNTITLACYATGFTPASLTYAWTKEGTALTNSIQYPPVQKNSLYSGISQIQVSKQDWDARKPFQCVVTHAAGSGVCYFPPIIGKVIFKYISSSFF